MTRAQLVDYEAQHFAEALEALEALDQSGRREVSGDLNLCFVCLQWACNNPACQAGQPCDLQLGLDRLEAK